MASTGPSSRNTNRSSTDDRVSSTRRYIARSAHKPTRRPPKTATTADPTRATACHQVRSSMGNKAASKVPALTDLHCDGLHRELLATARAPTSRHLDAAQKVAVSSGIDTVVVCSPNVFWYPRYS